MSIGPGPGSVAIELYTAASVTDRWERALWDGDHWAAFAWQPIECEVLEAEYRTGAGQEAGILSVPDAGALDVRVYDPARLLDPMATGSPYFGAVRPGTPLRLVGTVPAAMPAWSGYLDEGRHELATAMGRLRAVDGIASLAQAEVPEGTALPNTLRARVRAVVAAVGLGETVPVQPEQSLLELVDDGGFEAGGPKWTYVNTQSPTGIATLSIAPEGTKSLRLKASATGTGSARQIVAAPPQPGRTYSIAGWVYRNAGNQPQIVMRGRDENGTLIGPVTTISGTISGAGAFESLAGSWTCPSDDSLAQLEVWCNASAANDDGYFDGISVLGPDPLTILPPDTPVAAHDGKARSAWAIIQDAALDALTYVWLDPAGVLRFTPWGSLPDAKYAVGCAPAGETGGVWLNGLASLEATSQGDAIRNSIRSYSSGTTFGPPLRDPNSIRAFGERRLDVPRIVPDAATWAARILSDRADAGLEVTLGEVRPYTLAELALLLEGASDGPSALRVADDSHGEPVDLQVAVIGAGVGVTANGWRFRLVTMIPRAEWDQTTPPPPEPPVPPPDPWHAETRTYVATSDALIALTSGGSKYGAGASSTLPVGAWSGWSYRALIQFPNIPGTKLRRLVSATLNLDTSNQVRVGFGSSPTIDVKRITGAWSAGSSSSPSGGNAVVWPGPAVTGSIRANVTTSQNAAVGIRVDSLVLPWLPASAGGSLAAQRGLALYGGSGSQADTTEFWPVEKGGSQRPELVLVLEVFD